MRWLEGVINMSEKPAKVVSDKALRTTRELMHVIIRLPRGDQVHTRVTVWAHWKVQTKIREMIPALCCGIRVIGMSGPVTTYLHDPRFNLDDTLMALRDQAKTVVVKRLVWRDPGECWLEDW